MSYKRRSKSSKKEWKNKNKRCKMSCSREKKRGEANRNSLKCNRNKKREDLQNNCNMRKKMN